MIESCKLLGDISISASEGNNLAILQSIKQSIPLIIKDKARQFLNLVFDLQNKKIILKIRDINKNDAKNFIYVGNTIASKANLWRLSSSNRNYLLEIGSMLEEYMKKCSESNLEEYYKDEIENVLSIFFEEKVIYRNFIDDSNKVSDIKVMNISMIEGYDDFNVNEDIYIIDDKNKKNLKDWKNLYSKTIIKAIFEKRGLKIEDIGLNTVSIIKDNGEEIFLVHTESYQKVLLEELIKPDKAIDDKLNCCICGKSGCLKDIGFKYSFFQKTKINWVYNLVKSDYCKNLSLCKECYKSIIIGEFIMGENYSIRIGNNNIFLAPKFIEDSKESYEFIQDTLDKFMKIAGTQRQFNATAFESIEEIFTEAEVYALENNFLLDMYFYEESNSATKIKKSKYQIDANYFIKVITTMRENERLFNNSFKNLNSIYYLYEKSTSDGDKQHAANLFMRDLGAIMGKIHLKRANILRNAYPVIRMKYYADKSNGKYEFLKSVHLVNYYLDKLKELDLLKKVDVDIVNISSLEQLPEELSGYIIENKMTSLEAGLFLLGHVVSDIANVQNKSSGNRAILESINMRGMNYREVSKLIAKATLKIRELSSKNEFAYIGGKFEILKFQAAMELIYKANKENKFKEYTKEEILNCINLGYLHSAKQRIINSSK